MISVLPWWMVGSTLREGSCLGVSEDSAIIVWFPHCSSKKIREVCISVPAHSVDTDNLMKIKLTPICHVCTPPSPGKMLQLREKKNLFINLFLVIFYFFPHPPYSFFFSLNIYLQINLFLFQIMHLIHNINSFYYTYIDFKEFTTFNANKF